LNVTTALGWVSTLALFGMVFNFLHFPRLEASTSSISTDFQNLFSQQYKSQNALPLNSETKHKCPKDSV
jgi:hypothetical protein